MEVLNFSVGILLLKKSIFRDCPKHDAGCRAGSPGHTRRCLKVSPAGISASIVMPSFQNDKQNFGPEITNDMNGVYMGSDFNLLLNEFFIKSDTGYSLEKRTIDAGDISNIYEEDAAPGKCRAIIILNSGEELISLPYDLNDDYSPFKVFSADKNAVLDEIN